MSYQPTDDRPSGPPPIEPQPWSEQSLPSFWPIEPAPADKIEAAPEYRAIPEPTGAPPVREAGPHDEPRVYAELPWAAPKAPRRGLGAMGVIALLLIGLMFGALGGGVAGGLVATNALRAELASKPGVSITTAAAMPVVPVAASASNDSNAAVQAVQKVQPAVVTVINTLPAQRTYGFFGQGTTQPTASGSGVVISPQGYIVTNNHVVDGYESLEVIYADGSKVPAKLVGTDQYADVAVIKVDGQVPAVAQLGDSNAVRIGETVIAIGSALGDFKNTVTQGVISAVGRSLDTGDGFSLENMLQTDAAINHGNSGGPLINLSGQVVGINTAIVRGSAFSGDVAEGLGFSIPSDTVSDVASQLISKGYFERPFLGIRWQAITPEIAKANSLPIEWGVYVQFVEADSAADKAGVRTGDIITQIGQYAIDDTNTFFSVLNRHKVGETVTLKVWRDGQTLDVQATFQSRPR
jgi:serine protease Do